MLSAVVPGTMLGGSLSRLFREAEDLLESSMARAMPGVVGGVFPQVNLWRQGDMLIAEAEVPGFAMDEVEVLASEDSLTLRGRRTQHVPEGATAIRVERRVMEFDRTIDLPVEIDPERVNATLVHGVLRVEMAIAASALPKRIEVRGVSECSGESTSEG